MVDWAPEAIEAAHRAMFQEPYDGTTAAMIGSGLDAAAAAQGIREEEMSDYKLLCERLLRRAENAEEIAATYQIERDALREENARLLEVLKAEREIFDKLIDACTASRFVPMAGPCGMTIDAQMRHSWVMLSGGCLMDACDARDAIREGGEDA